MSAVAGVAVVLGVILGAIIGTIFNLHSDVNRLKTQVACLERPHGESSIAGVMTGTGTHRRFTVTHPATTTGCTP